MKNKNEIFVKMSKKGEKLSEKELSKAKKMKEEIDKKISEIKLSYEIGKQFYSKEITKEKGIEKLVESGINENSVVDYLNLFSKLINGELYINPIDNDFIQYYFQEINKEYKEKGTKNALLAFTQHLDFYKNIALENSKMSTEIFDKYWDIGFVGRKIHPNNTAVKTRYVGGINGIITKRIGDFALWSKYKMYSNLLAECLNVPNNNLTEAYSINLAKKNYWVNLTELSNQKNHFEDEKGKIYLVKSINTNNINSSELEISNLNFDFLVLFIYDLKNNPLNRFEIPVEVVKKHSKEHNSKYNIAISEKFITEKNIVDISVNTDVMERWLG